MRPDNLLSTPETRLDYPALHALCLHCWTFVIEPANENYSDVSKVPLPEIGHRRLGRLEFRCEHEKEKKSLSETSRANVIVRAHVEHYWVDSFSA